MDNIVKLMMLPEAHIMIWKAQKQMAREIVPPCLLM